MTMGSQEASCSVTGPRDLRRVVRRTRWTIPVVILTWLLDICMLLLVWHRMLPRVAAEGQPLSEAGMQDMQKEYAKFLRGSKMDTRCVDTQIAHFRSAEFPAGRIDATCEPLCSCACLRDVGFKKTGLSMRERMPLLAALAGQLFK